MQFGFKENVHFKNAFQMKNVKHAYTRTQYIKYCVCVEFKNIKFNCKGDYLFHSQISSSVWTIIYTKK